MKLLSDVFEINIWPENDYSPNTGNHLKKYERIYNIQYEGDNCYKLGIEARRKGNLIGRTLITGIPRSLTLQASKNSVLIKNDTLFICLGNKICALSIPYLYLLWDKMIDMVWCIGVLAYQQDLIIHGECHISRIDEQGNVKWTFSGKDIFTDLTIREDRIQLKDWEGNHYQLNAEGKLC